MVVVASVFGKMALVSAFGKMASVSAFGKREERILNESSQIFFLILIDFPCNPIKKVLFIVCNEIFEKCLKNMNESFYRVRSKILNSP